MLALDRLHPHEFPPRQCGPCLGQASQYRRPISVTPGRLWSLRGLGWSGLEKLAPDAHGQAIDADPRLQSNGAHVILSDPHRGVEAGRLVGKNLDSDVGSGTGAHNERQCARAHQNHRELCVVSRTPRGSRPTSP